MVDLRSNGRQDSARAANFIIRDRRSSWLQRNSEAENAQKTWGNRPRKYFIQENSRYMSRQCSVDSISSKQNRDMVTGANLTPHTRFPSFSLDVPCNPKNPCNITIPTMMSLRTPSPGSLRLQHQIILPTPSAV